jgi:hypothetical protein
MFFSSRQTAWRIWLVAGLGLCGYSQYLRMELVEPTESQLEQQVEARFAEEYARLGEKTEDPAFQMSPEWQQKYRAAIRAELTRPMEQERKRINSSLGFGLLLTVIASGMFVSSRMLTARDDAAE